MIDRWDAVVVGAGPAGAAAAIELRSHGLDVLLIDKSRFPRDKCCGDGLTAMALRQLDAIGFEPNSCPSWNHIDTVSLRSPSSRMAKIRFPSGRGQYAAVVKRFEFDNSLLQLAIRRAAVFQEATTVVSLRQEQSRSVLLSLSNGDDIRASYVIGADGAYSPTRRLLGEPLVRMSSDWHAFRQYFPLQTDPHDIFVSFESDLLPAYVWAFPLADAEVNVGFGLHLGVLERLGEMNALWSDMKRRDHLQPFLSQEPVSRLKAWPIPGHVDGVSLSIGRVLFVGDASAACDPLTGEGIGQALLSGQLAGRAIASHSPSHHERACRAYEERMRSALFTDNRWSRLLMRGLSHRKGARAGVRISGSNPIVGAIIARWMFEEFSRRQILNPARLVRAKSGAFR